MFPLSSATRGTAIGGVCGVVLVTAFDVATLSVAADPASTSVATLLWLLHALLTFGAQPWTFLGEPSIGTLPWIGFLECLVGGGAIGVLCGVLENTAQSVIDHD